MSMKYKHNHQSIALDHINMIYLRILAFAIKIIEDGIRFNNVKSIPTYFWNLDNSKKYPINEQMRN